MRFPPPFPPVFSDVRFRGFQDVAGVRIRVFKNPTDVRKTPQPPKAAENFWPFFLFFGAKSRFQWENDEFWSILESIHLVFALRK